ncbi:MAG: hypothetical protein Q8Q48_04165 [Candidatus Staskawiczbacteria bacterium]|nr:hypothetical protein [Candidatus Staskawiczbacteria bacterium]
MKSKFYPLKQRVIELRKSGKTYGEIIKKIGQNIPKSTLSDWCSKIYLSSKQKRLIDKKVIENCRKGMEIARIANRVKREKYLHSINARNKHLIKIFQNKDINKIALSMLYLGEGSKGLGRGSLRFGNSDSFVIDLFLNLIRKCYIIDEKKFRCTILCRADQDITKLEKFWQKATKIPKTQFYKTRIDARTIGKPTKKSDYKGVCVIDYFSADIFLDLMQIPKIIHK